MEFDDCIGDPAGRTVLQRITGGACAERLEHIFTVLVHCTHHELGGGKQRLQSFHAFDTGDPGQMDVHQDDIGNIFMDVLQGFLGRGIAGQAFQPLVPFNDGFEPFPHFPVIFHDDDGYNFSLFRHEAKIGRNRGPGNPLFVVFYSVVRWFDGCWLLLARR